jgi:ADP-ribosylglycohydrolase
MFKDSSCLRAADGLLIELAQSRGEGRDVSRYEAEARQIHFLDAGHPGREPAAERLLDLIAALPIPDEIAAAEPSGIDAIRALAPGMRAQQGPAPEVANDALVHDRLLGAWLGRCAGCLVGNPFEDWPRERIVGFLKETNNYALARYASSNVGEALRKKYSVEDVADAYCTWYHNWIDNVSCAPEDDDTNYTVLALRVLERHGERFTSENVAERWLADLPFLRTCTAERVAYRNVACLRMPPASATFRNPYREWIGAQIRADLYGYVSPSQPARAAAMAWRDAAVSHVKNGIYGAMFVAATLAAAWTASDAADLIRTGLSVVPPGSRLAWGITRTLQWHAEGVTLETAITRLHALYDEKDPHAWCLAVTNIMVVCVALLFGRLDFTRSIGAAVECGFDTDCNAATVGSVIGIAKGAAALPDCWTDPLHDTLLTGIGGEGRVSISGLAKRTQAVIRSFRASGAG